MALGAEKRASSLLFLFCDGRLALLAWLLVFAVDSKVILEVAEFAVGLFVVFQGRAAAANGVLEHAADVAQQMAGRGFIEGVAGRCGMDAGVVQGFAGVNVAEPTDKRLIHKSGLYSGGGSGQAGMESLGTEEGI